MKGSLLRSAEYHSALGKDLTWSDFCVTLVCMQIFIKEEHLSYGILCHLDACSARTFNGEKC